MTFKAWLLSVAFRILRTRTPFAAFLASLLHLQPGDKVSPPGRLSLSAAVAAFQCFAAVPVSRPSCSLAPRCQAPLLCDCRRPQLLARRRIVPCPGPDAEAAQCVPGKDIERLVKSCCSVEPFSVTSASRRTPDLAARLAEVTEHVTRLSPHCDPYGPAFLGINMKEEDRHQAFNPYRSLDPERLKLSGRGQWDPAPFVEDSLYLALREPQSLLLPSVPWPDPSQVPSLQEDPEKVLALAKVWDANDLLVLSPRGPPAVRG